MKAISVKSPFGPLTMQGHKPIETRTWPTNYRGELLLCASKKPHDGYVILPNNAGFFKEAVEVRSSVAVSVFKSLALYGVALCVVDLVDCREMKESDDIAACCRWYAGAYAWVFENIRPVEQVQVVGALSFFEVDNQLIKYL